MNRIILTFSSIILSILTWYQQSIRLTASITILWLLQISISLRLDLFPTYQLNLMMAIIMFGNLLYFWPQKLLNSLPLLNQHRLPSLLPLKLLKQEHHSLFLIQNMNHGYRKTFLSLFGLTLTLVKGFYT